jgi:thiaminase/transcriptional activator TenA
VQDCFSDDWNAVVNHPFTDQLAAATIGEDAMRRYLIQDHRFLDSFVVLLSSMVAHAPTLKVIA